MVRKLRTRTSSAPYITLNCFVDIEKAELSTLGSTQMRYDGGDLMATRIDLTLADIDS